MKPRDQSSKGASRLSVALLCAALSAVNFPISGFGQASASPQNDPANQHKITVAFDYDFGKNPSCAEKPALKTCIKQFVVYDASVQRARLFAIPVPDGARGLVKGIRGESPMRVFLPGKHLIAVTAQNANGVESQVNAAGFVVEVKPKTTDSNSPAK